MESILFKIKRKTTHSKNRKTISQAFFLFLVDLFEEIRPTKQVSILPVGLVGGVLAEKPQVKGQYN